MIDFESKLPFKVYVGEEGQTINDIKYMPYRNRPIGTGGLDYKLYSFKDRFLPFQVRLPISEGGYTDDIGVDDWFLYDCEGNLVVDIGFSSPTAISQIDIETVYGDAIYYTYKADTGLLLGTLPSGYYYFEIVIPNDNGRSLISELFYIPKNDSEYDTLTLVESWNSCDLPDVIYQKGFVNKFFLDGRMLLGEPKVEKEGFENGAGEFIETMARYIDRYSYDNIFPEYIYHALLYMRMHDNVWLTEPTTKRRGQMTISKVSPTWDKGGKSVEIKLELEQVRRIVKGGCCENKTFSSIIVVEAVDDIYKIDNNTNASPYILGNILSNDIGQNISIVTTGTIISSGGNTVQLSSNGSFSYNIPFMISGYDTFTYTIQDQYGAQSVGTVLLSFAPFNAVNDSFFVSISSAGTYPIPTTGFSAFANVLLNDHIPYNITDPSNPIVGTGQTIMIPDNQGHGNFIEVDRYTGHVDTIIVNNLLAGSNTFTYALKPLIGQTFSPSAVVTITY